MQDLEDRLKELGGRLSRRAPSELRPTARALRRIRVGRAVRSGVVLATVAALIIGGFAGARSLLSDEALPPADQDANVSPFVDTWTTTDVDGRTRTMVIRASGKNAYEISLLNHLALVCSGAPSTLTGTGHLFRSKYLVIPAPVITWDYALAQQGCDDGSVGGHPGPSPPEELLRDLTFEYDPESDILTNYSPIEVRRNRGHDRGTIYYGLTLVWGRAEAENRIGNVSGWVTYGDKRGIWARDLTSPADPSDRVRISSEPGTPIAWSRDGSKLLVVRDNGGFVVNSDGTETRVTDTNGSIEGSSFSPDGTAVVYAVVRADYSSAIYVVDAEGGSPRLLLTSGSRRYPDPDKPGAYKQSDDGDDLFETLVQAPKWSPDGSQIAYFDGMGDWGNSLKVMDSDGTDSRVLVENSETLGQGHVYGLEWSPVGSQLAFSIGGRLYVVGVDGSGFRLVTDRAVDPHWSPDGSYIAYTLPDRQGNCADCVDLEHGSLEIVRLDDFQAQNFGAGGSGPWTAELGWRPNAG
jgi:roadblock/LC7 domain-containing protein